jgi:hypothetical protein
LIATSVIAAAATPFAANAFGPTMSGQEFVAAVRCTAIEQAAHPDADLSAQRLLLNMEARSQPVEAAAAARAEVLAISRAKAGEAPMLGAERGASCGASMAAGEAASAV